MNIALLGNGKTGQEVAKLSPNNTTIFNSTNPPNANNLKGFDIIISFLPGNIFLEYIPMLITTGIPVVTGSTGFKWPRDIQSQLQKNNLKWIHAGNFSLGMNIVKKMIQILGKTTDDGLFDDAQFKIHEVHHTQKLDAPSGTALSFSKWLGQKQNVPITSDRTGDVVGEHQITFSCTDEQITLKHIAKDRSIFARGALWAAKLLVEDDKSIPVGINHFNNIVEKQLNL